MPRRPSFAHLGQDAEGTTRHASSPEVRRPVRWERPVLLEKQADRPSRRMKPGIEQPPHLREPERSPERVGRPRGTSRACRHSRRRIGTSAARSLQVRESEAGRLLHAVEHSPLRARNAKTCGTPTVRVGGSNAPGSCRRPSGGWADQPRAGTHSDLSGCQKSGLCSVCS